jgi:hypothetical protein
MKEFWPIETGRRAFRSQLEPKVATLVTAAPATTKRSPKTATTASTTARRRCCFRTVRFRFLRRRA